jgi:predicted PurR-regulated permease PerM
MMWVALLIAAYLIDGRRMVRTIERRVPASYRRQTDRLASVSYTALAGYARGTLLVSMLCGIVVLILGLAAGIELVVVAALWAFLWDLVPQIGGIIGGIPLLLFAIAVSPTAFLVVLVIYTVYQLIESNIIYPALIGDSVELPAWVALVAVLAGAAAAGVIGAIVLTPIVAAVRLIVREYRKEDFPGRVVPADPA